MSAPVTGTAETVARPRGRPIRLGSPEAAAADRDCRRREYADLRTKLALSSRGLAEILGMSPKTVKAMPWWGNASSAPTDATIAKMRAEIVRRARVTLEEAEMRTEIERELAVHQARWHVEKYAREAETLEDAA